jgi:hypothetical protein
MDDSITLLPLSVIQSRNTFSYTVESPGLVEITTESHDTPGDHQYVATLDDVMDDALAYTCPHHVHRNAYCKHMATVEYATDHEKFDNFLLKDDEDDTGLDKRNGNGCSDFPAPRKICSPNI